jgi:sugar phosphate isomerase/epimerase
MTMKSVQQIMLGTVCTNEKNALETLRRIKGAGYDALELNSFMTHPTPVLVRLLTKAAGMPTGACGKLDWKALLKETSLDVSAYHTDLGSLERDVNAVIEEAKGYGTDRIVITGMYRFDYGSAQAISSLAKRLNSVGKQLQENGLRLFYHNHNAELLRLHENSSKNECAYVLLLRETDPELVFFEFDSYWFADCGASPLSWMQALGPRMKLWHIADRGTRLNKTPMTPILKSDSVELGTGNMPLVQLKEQALKNGIEVVVLESHRNWIDKDPVKSLEISAKWLNQNL